MSIKKSQVILRWAEKTKPCFVALKFFPGGLPVKVCKTLNDRWSYILSLYYYMRNFCDLIGLEQWHFSLIP